MSKMYCLLDVTPLSLGIETLGWRDDQTYRGQYHRYLPANPKSSLRLSTTSLRSRFTCCKVNVPWLRTTRPSGRFPPRRYNLPLPVECLKSKLPSISMPTVSLPYHRKIKVRAKSRAFVLRLRAGLSEEEIKRMKAESRSQCRSRQEGKRAYRQD